MAGNMIVSPSAVKNMQEEIENIGNGAKGDNTYQTHAFTANEWTRAGNLNVHIPANSFYFIKASADYNNSSVTGVGISQYGGTYSPIVENTNSSGASSLAITETGVTTSDISRYIFARHTAAGNNATRLQYWYFNYNP